jgi:Uma2 family endonuclease
MPHAAEWTYERYASLPDDGNKYEVIDGTVCVTPAPGTRHQMVAAELFVALYAYVDTHGLGTMIWDVDLLFVSRQYLRPDMLFVSAAELGGLRKRGVTSKPGLVVEVLSPESGRYDRVLKPERYRAFGVNEYWVVDPTARVVEQYQLSEPADRPIVCSEKLRWQPDPAVPALELLLDPIFSVADGVS